MEQDRGNHGRPPPSGTDYSKPGNLRWKADHPRNADLRRVDPQPAVAGRGGRRHPGGLSRSRTRRHQSLPGLCPCGNRTGFPRSCASYRFVRFLIDRCAGRRLADRLRELGHDVLESRERGSDPGDPTILIWAASEQRILVTMDKDFGNLVFLQGERHRGLVRLPDVPAQASGRGSRAGSWWHPGPGSRFAFTFLEPRGGRERGERIDFPGSSPFVRPWLRLGSPGGGSRRGSGWPSRPCARLRAHSAAAE